MVIVLGMSQVAVGQSACDLDGSGTTDVVDVNRAISMVLGAIPCTAKVEGTNVCSIVTLQRVVNVVLGQACVVYNAVPRTVTLTWFPSASAGVVGYNLYRRSTPTDAPVKLNTSPITGTSFVDTAIQLGTTYYYSATSVDGSGNESDQSGLIPAVIPAS